MTNNTILRYNNMDLMRYVLSIAVIVAHYNIIMGTDIYWFIDSGTAVGLFLGISGYLVCGCYEKQYDLKKLFLSFKR